jgi:hypothetical protein
MTKWAEEEIKALSLGDARLGKRVVTLTEQLAQRPGASIPQACGDWAQTQAAYRLLAHEDTSGQADPDARLFRKGAITAAILAYQGHVLMENRTGLVVGAVVTHADGFGERSAALAMLDTLPGAHRKTVAADKGYDTRDFIADCRKRGVTPHVASHTTRWGGSAVDGRTTRHPGYATSQVVRKRIEEHFGWGKTVGRIRQTVFRGLQRVDQQFKLTMTASNIVRMARLLCLRPQRALQ